MQKTAFISIIGRPNVGKSSILNRLIGQKIAIVTPKPQTTRTRIMGVLTEGDTQLVFTDTPGFHQPKTLLGEKMVQAVGDSISGVDVCMLVVEPEKEIHTAEVELLNKIKKLSPPAVLVINKIDTLKNKAEILQTIDLFRSEYDFDAIVPVSAKDGDGLDDLLQVLLSHAYESVHFFPDDALTDQPERVIAAEIIREKLLLLLDKEIPHGTAVSIERFYEREDGSGILDIDAEIYCERDSHKGIIIGKKGAMLKEVSTRARLDMENFFGCKVFLTTHVKVKEGWRNRSGLIRNFGLD